MSGEGTLAARPDGLGPSELTPEAAAEREACLRAMRDVHARLDALPRGFAEEADLPEEIDADAFRLELTRLDEAIESVRLGLHRVGE